MRGLHVEECTLTINKKGRGRRKTTGRFDRRDKLENTVLWMYHYCNRSIADIAKNTHVSEATVTKIIDTCPKEKGLE